MTRGKIRVIAHRRRREGRTDFRQRLRLLKSGKSRFVVRRSVNSMTCQVVKHDSSGDRTLATASSKQLGNLGWKGSAGNLPGSYLTGLLCGVRAREAGVKQAILDTGLQSSTKGSRIYGALKGALDAGLEIPHSQEVLPPDDRVAGGHIEKYSESSGKKREISKQFDKARVSILKKSKPAGKAKETKPRAKPEKKKVIPKKSRKK
jgi:large subunit ribosomal protein L18